MQTIRSGNHLERLERLWDQQRQDRTERIAKYGWKPNCECAWCGDTGLNPAEGSICHCAAGDAKAQRIARVASWPLLVPTHFEQFTLASCPNRRLAEEVTGWLAAKPVETGRNLVIQGKVGVGKTGVAIAALRELHMAGYTVAYWSLPTLMDIFRQEERGTKLGKDFNAGRQVPMMEQLTRADCILLDDLGQERVTDYVAERLYVLIDGRYVANRPTVLTTNLSKDDLEEHIGERSSSRLRENYLAVRGLGRDLRDRTGNES